MDALSGWLTIILYVGGIGGFLIATVALVRRSERRLGGGRSNVSPAAPAAPGGSPDPITTYLDQMTPELMLPAEDVAEVRAELADHLGDSIANLEAEGLEREDAVREALGRLGPPRELGRQLRIAHQSTRRLLAGVGGGIFAAGGGFVLGYLGGTAVGLLLMLATVAGATALSTVVGLHLPDMTSGDGGSTANSILLAIAIAVAAAAATRYAVRTSAGLSRRSPGSVAVFWAVAAVLGFGWWFLFAYRGPQSWPSVAIELCIPLIAAAAAIVRVERPMPHVGRWAIVVLLVGAIVPMVLLLGVTSSGPASMTTISQSGPEPDLHLATVAPMAPAAWLPDGAIIGGGWGSDASGTRVAFDLNPSLSGLTMGSVLANWRDIRFEAWRALPDSDPGSTGIDPQYTTPLLAQPAVISGDSLQAVLHLERMRYSGMWWVVLTGIGPDGGRYLLQVGGGGNTSFNGSVWDWLTTAQ
jgi:hypothetical protein